MTAQIHQMRPERNEREAFAAVDDMAEHDRLTMWHSRRINPASPKPQEPARFDWFAALGVCLMLVSAASVVAVVVAVLSKWVMA